ncbi:hypothetical protein KBC04_04300 [Candidatus Babeliales bacterium]|nr:hypothetical protein [Candidatus Babeliales bacterium]MBP9844287.1 hypothetical protein [Candidatus Babeliales bacterium]
MKNMKNYIALIGLLATFANLQSQQSKQDIIILNLIKSMEECVVFEQETQKQLQSNKYLAVAEFTTKQNKIWQNAVNLYHTYISDARKKNQDVTAKNFDPLADINQNSMTIDQLMVLKNQYKLLFERLLNEYIIHFGQIYEKKSGLLGAYRSSYYISSADDQAVSITPNEYILFTQALDSASKLWGTIINLTLPVVQENRSIIQKNLTLDEITRAVKNVPLSQEYYTAATLLTAAATTAAVAAGVYYAYNNYDQSPDLTTSAAELTKEVTQIETSLNTSSPAPQEQNNTTPTPPSSDATPSQQKPQAEPKQAQTYIPGKAGLEFYVNKIMPNQDFDNSFSSDSYVQPDALDTTIATPVTETMQLPIHIKNRAQIASQNLQNPNYTPGKSVEKYIKTAESTPDFYDDNSYIAPDEGDYALKNNAQNLLLVASAGSALRAGSTATKVPGPSSPGTTNLAIARPTPQIAPTIGTTNSIEAGSLIEKAAIKTNIMSPYKAPTNSDLAKQRLAETFGSNKYSNPATPAPTNAELARQRIADALAGS